MLGAFGETLVVDWGLAKVVGVLDGVAGSTLRPHSGGPSGTVSGWALGTPAYMAPEQPAGRLDELGPATDVYGLGATLYEVLTGRPPFGRADLDAVQKGRFPPPRTVLPTVPRALEAVCRKAMAVAPGERYASALALARDVERWLADEPVAAYPEPAGARVRRWVRRHVRLMTGVAAALAVGLEATGALAWQRELARQALSVKEAETARERDTAREQKRLARQALYGTAMAAMSGWQKRELTAVERETLQNLLEYYKEFAAEAATDEINRTLKAEAHSQVGDLRRVLGQTAEAVAAYQAALSVYERLVADFSAVRDYRSYQATGYIKLANLLADQGKGAEAEAAYRAALAASERLVADYPGYYRSELSRSNNNLANLLGSLGKLTEAEAAYRAALALQERLAAEFQANSVYHRHNLALIHNNLGVLLAGMGRRPEAEAAYRAALSLRERLANDHPYVSAYREELEVTSLGLSGLLAAGGKVADAVAIAGRFADSPAPAAKTLYDCGCVFALASAAADNPAADAHAARAVELLRRAVGKGFRNVPHLLKDTDLDPRRRDDYAALMWELADAPPAYPNRFRRRDDNAAMLWEVADRPAK